MSSPIVRIVGLPHITMPMLSGGFPVSFICLSTSASPSAFPVVQAAGDGILKGSTEKKFLPVGRISTIPRVGAPLPPGRTCLPERAAATESISSVVCSNFGSTTSLINSTTLRTSGLSSATRGSLPSITSITISRAVLWISVIATAFVGNRPVGSACPLY